MREAEKVEKPEEVEREVREELPPEKIEEKKLEEAIEIVPEEKIEEARPAVEEEKKVEEEVRKPKLKPEPEAPLPPSKAKKINKMSLAEIEAKLEDVKEKMGGWNSNYAQQLIKRKNYLESLQ